MVKIVFDISSLQTKLFLALMIITIFNILYLAVPRDEFYKIEHFAGIEKDITYLDIVQYSILSQVGIQNVILYPKTIRTRILTMIQLFLGYTILLM